MRYAKYQYDSWGKLLSITGSMADTIGVKNPFRYRGYYYDTDTGLYYLQSRYYDPEIGRFINADALLGANADMQAYDLFAYCSNDPVNCSDPAGCGKIRDAWNWVKGKASSAWNSVKNWASNTFGAGYTDEYKTDEPFSSIPFETSPVRITSGIKAKTTIVNRGNSNKPISVYAKTVNSKFAQANAGIKLNLGSAKAQLSLGLDDIGLYIGAQKGDKQTIFGITISLREFQIKLLCENTVNITDSTSSTSYNGIIVDAWLAYAIVVFVTSGIWQSSPGGSPVPQPAR